MHELALAGCSLKRLRGMENLHGLELNFLLEIDVCERSADH